MLNRIRISTTLFLILILCGVLQVGSNGLSFWAFRDGYQNLQEVETSNQQRSALAQTRAVLLQASTALNKAGTLTALSYPPDDIKALMVTARDSLKQADAIFKSFTAEDAVSEQGKKLRTEMQKGYAQWHGDLEHQATWLENNQLSDFLTAPVQESQAVFDKSFNAWQQDKKYADRERNAVNAELTLARTRDGMRMAQVSAETINPAHPGSRFSGGNLETLSDKPGSPVLDALHAFRDKYYSANLMKAVVYSNKPLPELAKIAAETYGRVPNKAITKPKIDVPVVTDAQKGVIIHYVPAMPRKVLRVEFRIDDNTAQFRSKTDELVNYLIGNRSAEIFGRHDQR
jgi:hypothetical protein